MFFFAHTTMSSEDEELLILNPFSYGTVRSDRESQVSTTAQLNYMTSRLRAALCECAEHSSKESIAWWLKGLRNEMVCYHVLSKVII
jgi:hypothetical protein